MKTTITIDAKGNTLGRVASAAAKALMGKTSADYAPNVAPKVTVEILNAQQTKMTEKRMKETLHERYSGYPGGLKMTTNARIIEGKGVKELYRLAVYNMLPANKLRTGMMKNLVIKA
ncbi:MAG: large subunit ribosomal protein [Patescibacteria group bacterium]|jgi:large subunit ribosomal protein L13|nr:large subunit ribosomal protein [Patescibacteria group bacterium]